MRIVILGSGVIGTAAAWFLARAGHEVVVVERRAGAGLETSFANAGEISPGYASPWAAPGVPLKALRWLFMHHRPLVVRPRLDFSMWRWCAAMLANCTAARFRVNKGRMVRLAEYSRDVLDELRAETGIEYDGRQLGTLELFRGKKQLDGVAKDIAVLDAHGVPYQLLDRDGAVAHEPALAAVAHKFAGALRLPRDQTGDCFLFTGRLAGLARRVGVDFRFGVSVLRLDAGQGVTAHTDHGPIAADACVVALGSFTPRFLKPLGLDLPVFPVKGYSLTLPIADAARASVSTVMDEAHKVAVTRLGDRIRVGGMAELAGFDLRLDARRRETLEFVANDLFPGGGDARQATFWCGLRPMTPDGTPLVGPTRMPGVWLATGHGTLGWTMAAGTGRLLADWMSGRPAAIDTEGLTLARYGRRR